MACTEWNDAWVARLWDEIEADEARTVDAHVKICADCRERLAGLESVRATLRAATPSVPAHPRVVVLQPRTFRRPLFAFAAGIAATLVVGTMGMLLGSRLPSPGAPQSVNDHPAAAVVPSSAILPPRPEDSARFVALEQQLARLSQDIATSGATPTDCVTPDDLQVAFRAMRREIDLQRARDVEFLVGEISATEWRAGHWVDETRDALRLVALQNDSRFTQR